MKRILALFSRAISAVRNVLVKCKETGEWIVKSVASIGVTPAQEVVETATEEALEEYGTAADLVSVEDDGHVERLLKQSAALLKTVAEECMPDRYQYIQSIARDMVENNRYDLLVLSALSPLQRDWILALTPEMRELVAYAEREDLVAHMKGGKSITGLIRCDKESIRDWERSVEMEAARAAYEVETAAMDGEPEWARGPMPAC